MADKEGAQICYIVVLILSLGFMIWGLMDLLKKKQLNETSGTDVISRQMRGMGYILLALVVLSLGGAACAGLSGNLPKMYSK